jgi:putative oxidoreductase
MIKILFAPGNNSIAADFGLLVLRVWIGLTMLLEHGWDKLTHFDKYASHFVSFMGLGPHVSLCLSIFAEFFASGLLVLGLVTRFAALVLVINMSVAFFVVMKGKPTGMGELPFVYLMTYVALLLAGPGRFSLDKTIFGKSGKSGWGQKK